MSNLSRISKVSRKGEELVITFASTDGETDKTTIVKSRRQPHADLVAAFSGLERHVREILDVPGSVWKDAMSISGVTWSFSEDTEVEGAVITGLVSLETCTSPFCFNTPHLPFKQYSEGGNAATMPYDAIEALERLRREAKLFLEGKGAQGDLFAGGAVDGKSAAAGEGRSPTDALADAVVDAAEQILAAEAQGAVPREGETTIRINDGPKVPMSTLEQAVGKLAGGGRRQRGERTGKAGVVFRKDRKGKKPAKADEEVEP